jgi:1-acyl-sn-glycerol-3-phosphate acyltransferase
MVQTTMRGVLAALLRWLGEALVRLYYPIRAVEGRKRVPAGGPVVFVLNHPNGLLDPVLLRVALGRPARFLAKSALFANPFGRLAMDAFGSIPIYRSHDSGARAKDVSRNDESFARCRAVLARGEALALFPEGVSHSDPQMRPLKTGAARIALSAEAEQGGRLGITVVPVGLYYEHKERFRSRVLLVVGEPIAIAPLLDDYARAERDTVDALTDQIRTRLDQVVLQAESDELLLGIARLARWTAEREDAAVKDGERVGEGELRSPEPIAGGAGPFEGPDVGRRLAAQHQRAREMRAAYETLRARDPARVEAVAAEARAYARALERLGVRDPWALELEALRPGRLVAMLAAVTVALPLAALGALMGWIPYRLAGVVAARVSRDEDDILGTVKLLAGALFLFLAWTGEAVALALLVGPIWALPTFLVGAGTGYLALRFHELASGTVEAARYLWLRAWRFDAARRLAEHRRALADAVARALREAA